MGVRKVLWHKIDQYGHLSIFIDSDTPHIIYGYLGAIDLCTNTRLQLPPQDADDVSVVSDAVAALVDITREEHIAKIMRDRYASIIQ